MKTSILALALIFLITSTRPPDAADHKPFVIHEWGTFTSLQDEQGSSLGAINNDDEPVPQFVHDIARDLLVGDARTQKTINKNLFVKSIPRAHPDVTMRLETPVLYVHPGSNPPATLDVSVDFRGGWLTQFYPKAVSQKPTSTTAPITRKTTSRLTWSGLRLNNNDATIPQTKDHVWLTPRNVSGAATLTNPAGESEKYLFYRGVGHLDAPLCATRQGDTLLIRAQLDPAIPANLPLTFANVWYCTIRPDGSCAWRAVDPINPLSSISTRIAATFTDGEFSTKRLADLKKDMHRALVSAGLFDDEAKAMLDTWDVSYFKSWGTRIFYIVPGAWTEHVLPLTVSPTPKEIRRVMVGRLDLVTLEHRELLNKIASATDVKSQDAQLWDAYDRLGRFRNALVLNELARTNSASLKQFIANHGLQPFGIERR